MTDQEVWHTVQVNKARYLEGDLERDVYIDGMVTILKDRPPGSTCYAEDACEGVDADTAAHLLNLLNVRGVLSSRECFEIEDRCRARRLARAVIRAVEKAGAVCTKCKTRNEYAAPSATYVCYECR